MAEEKEQKYRVNAYVDVSTYEKLLAIQAKKKIQTNKKVSQGQVLDEIFKDVKVD